MVDVGVARDEDDVAGVPAQLFHFGARHGQERRNAEALGPVFAVGGERLGAGVGLHWRILLAFRDFPAGACGLA